VSERSGRGEADVMVEAIRDHWVIVAAVVVLVAALVVWLVPLRGDGGG
jgi:hypothetical protein